MLRRPPISASRERMLASPTPAYPRQPRIAEMPMPSSAITRWIAKRRKHSSTRTFVARAWRWTLERASWATRIDGAFRCRGNEIGFPDKVEPCLEVRAAVEAFDQRVRCADKSQLLQRRRMSKVGNRTDSLLRFRHQVLDLPGDTNRFLVRRLAFEIAQEQPGRDQQLRRESRSSRASFCRSIVCPSIRDLEYSSFSRRSSRISVSSERVTVMKS